MNKKLINGIIIGSFVVIMIILLIQYFNLEKNLDSVPDIKNDENNYNEITDVLDLEIINKNFNPADEPEKYIQKNTYNSYKNYNASTGDIANLYYQHFKILYLKNKNEALKKVSHLPTDYMLDRNYMIINYYKNQDDVFVVEDEVYQYIFYISSVLDYNVKIEKKVEDNAIN